MRIKYNLLPYSFLRHVRMYTTKKRLQVEMEKQLTSSLEANEIKPRKHPGLMKIKTVQVPASAVNAMTVILKDKPVRALYSDAMTLAHYLNGRHPPAEVETLNQKAKQIQHELEDRLNLDRAVLSEEETRKVDNWCRHQIARRLRHRTYNWQPVIYDEHKALQYMLARFAPEYAVLCKIFSEIKKRQPDFHPFTLFDFGSGVGSVTWAARTIWGDTVREFFNVDSSSTMNDLASLLLRDGNEDKEMSIKGVFYRQFLPASQTVKYDIIVSAYSLLELPYAEARLQTLINLWNKTNSYLVLVEQGTNVGFQIINEARDFILDLSNRAQVHASTPLAHVFSPCPHDLTCPRYQEDKTPCNFEVSYLPVPLMGRSNVKRERFSYVILKKGPRLQNDQEWPRIVREPLVRRKHTVCRLCTAAGKLEEIIFTASKHGKMPYWCARSSNWGDLLPVSVKEELQSEET